LGKDIRVELAEYRCRATHHREESNSNKTTGSGNHRQKEWQATQPSGNVSHRDRSPAHSSGNEKRPGRSGMKQLIGEVLVFLPPLISTSEKSEKLRAVGRRLW
jgi:hypothetical protein